MLKKAILVITLGILIVAAFGCKSSTSTTATTTSKVATTAASSTATAVPTSTTTAPVQTGTLKIAVMGPLSGPAASYGNGMVQMVQKLFDDTNAKGGLKVGNTLYTLQLVTADDLYSGTGAVTAANKLVSQDNVKFVIGSISATTIQPSMPVFQQNKVMAIYGGAQEMNPAWTYGFKMVQPITMTWDIMYGALAKKYPAAKRVAVISTDTDAGKITMDSALKQLPILGLTVSTSKLYTGGTTDFYPIISAVLASKPDIIETGSAPQGDAIVIIRQAREQGFTGPIVAATYDYVPTTMLKSLGAAANNTYSLSADFGSKLFPPEVNNVDKYLTDKYGTQKGAPSAGILAYNGAAGLLAALQAAGTIDVDAVVKAQENVTWDAMGIKGFQYGGLKTYGIKHQLITYIMDNGIENGVIVNLAFYNPGDIAAMKLPALQ